jgi:hypothetical protein
MKLLALLQKWLELLVSSGISPVVPCLQLPCSLWKRLQSRPAQRLLHARPSWYGLVQLLGQEDAIALLIGRIVQQEAAQLAR